MIEYFSAFRKKNCDRQCFDVRPSSSKRFFNLRVTGQQFTNKRCLRRSCFHNDKAFNGLSFLSSCRYLTPLIDVHKKPCLE